MWIVMEASAKMPRTCWGRYRKVALVQLTQHATAWGLLPVMISERSRAVQRVVQLGNHHVGNTDRGAYQRVLAEARRRAHELNNSAPEATADLLFSWGGSA